MYVYRMRNFQSRCQHMCTYACICIYTYFCMTYFGWTCKCAVLSVGTYVNMYTFVYMYTCIIYSI